ncbi:MAG: EAL domain-containing protein [Desulfobacterales bacterium]|nr:EAL domain-containing protein [Desulfobacterales bacterium]
MENDKKSRIVSNIFKTSLLRNIFITSLVVSAIFPLYSVFYIVPSFTTQLAANTEDEAVRTAAYLASSILNGKPELTRDSLSNDSIIEIRKLKEDFRLEKLKIFSKHGEIIFSTTPDEIGEINKNDYFYNIVAKGNVFTKIVRKDSKSLEGRIVTADVVETYVPVLSDGKFTGAFEIYYDITGRKKGLDKLLTLIYSVLFGISSVLLITVIAISFKASKNMLGRDRAEKALRKAHEGLEKMVEERTADLAETNRILLAEVKERRTAEEALRQSEERYQALFNRSLDCVYVYDFEGNFIDGNPAVLKLLCYTREDIPSLNFASFIDSDQIVRAFQILDELKKTGTQQELAEFRLRSRDGRYVEVETKSSVIFRDGKPYAILGVARDITDRKQAEEKLKKSEKKYRELYDFLPIPVYETDLEANINSANRTMFETFGYDEKDLNEGFNAWQILSSGETDKFKENIQRLLNKEKIKDTEYTLKRKDGSVFPAIVISSIRASEGKPRGLRVAVVDITERKQMESRLTYLAYYDDLTGLPNRSLFADRLTQAISRAGHNKRNIAVLLLDIGRFKSINDIYGFDAGNAVLKEIAERLSNTVRDGDTVARMGESDYGVLLNDVAYPADILAVAKKIMGSISQPVFIKEQEILLNFSIGIAFHPNDGDDADTLLKNADLAHTKAKQMGMKSFQLYTKDLDIQASQFALMEKNLPNAFKNEEFILHYQPYYDTGTKKINGMEALVRWNSPEFGLVPPVKFIPVLEETGLIIEVGKWILKEAVRQVKEWQEKGYNVVPVSVNLSSLQFRQKDLAEMIERTIRTFDLDPCLLTLEITESAFMQDFDYTGLVLGKLRKLGICIAIDDFGTGYSSLSYLKRLPVDYLKIDISFVREIVTAPDTASIVKAIIAMAHTLNLKTIAEGVEMEEQWKILNTLGCDTCQGFYFCRPLPNRELINMIR